MIEDEVKGRLRIYRLEDGEDRLQIDLNPGKQWVAFFKSKTYNFKQIVEEDPTRQDAQDKLEEELDIETVGKTQIAGLFPDEISIVLLEGSELHAGEKWVNSGRKLHPVKKDD